MANEGVRFIRKNGRIIPIGGKAAAVGASALLIHRTAKGASGLNSHRKLPHQSGIKVNKGLDALGLGISVASGAIAAATFGHGGKALVAGAVAAHAIDVGGVAANVASVAGKGKTKQRAIQGARQEARNLVIGNAVYLAGIAASKTNRKAAVGYAEKILAFGRKALRVA